MFKQWGIEFVPTGLTPLLKRIGFVYRKTTQVPAKADRQAQQKFVAEIDELFDSRSRGDHFYYIDAVHPQHNTRPRYGWIARGTEFTVMSNTGRERLNINGAVNAFDVSDVVVREDERINAESTIALYRQLQRRHPRGGIYIICDNAKCYRSRDVQRWLKTSRVIQLFLPPYSSPRANARINLNLIERLWKFLRKKVIDAEYYPTKEVFREAVMGFFSTIKKYRAELESLLTLNFRMV